MMITEIPKYFNTSDNNLEKEFYETCFKWAIKYDRGVGYFSSGWLTKNLTGLVDFIARGGISRWIVSPILDEQDFNVLQKSMIGETREAYFNEILHNNIRDLEKEMAKDILNALAWMVYDNILEFRFALPKNKLENGNFHDKFGIFYGAKGDALSFNGSINDSKQGLINYESIKTFCSWDFTSIYVKPDIERFEKLWVNNDPNLEVMHMRDAIRNKLIQLRNSERPYNKVMSECNKWVHQDIAVKKFLQHKNGILEMATGTGKTRVALRIMAYLFAHDKVDNVIITLYGTDLLYQWEEEIRLFKKQEIRLFRYFEKNNEILKFLKYKNKSIFLVARDADKLNSTFTSLLEKNNHSENRTLIIFDEVHGMGAESIRKKLVGKIVPFEYRLGLSATPEREYDLEGNSFIEKEIGEVIFTFTLKEAIQRGILCEFDYMPLSYILTAEEKRKKRDIIAAFALKRKRGIHYKIEEEYRALSKVNKKSVSKLICFKDFLKQNPWILNRSLIYVEDKEYGELVQEIIIKYVPEYHTFYSEDERKHLIDFARGDLECLITCKKISEGIDIKDVENIILFSSDKAKLVTIQRIGRSLRINNEKPKKRAFVLDFINSELSNNSISNSDLDRCQWLSEISKTRREQEDE